MDVILLERIERLGQMGDVVKVKSGYARNFLLPQKKALRATEENKKHFEGQRTQLEADNLSRREDAEKLAKKMDGLSVTLVRQAGESGQLYGSVNARDIAASVTEAGFTINRQQLELAHPIKILGLHQVQVVIHPEISIDITVNVARSKDEAKTQAKTGKAVTSAEEEEKAAALEEAEQMAAKADEETQAAEEAADEAVTEQAEAIFEEGAVPEPASETEETDQESGEEEKSE